MDTLDKMCKVVLTGIQAYRDDFAYDREEINEMRTGEFFLWQVRPTGTYLFSFKELKSESKKGFCLAVLKQWEDATWFLIAKDISFTQIPREAIRQMCQTERFLRP